MLVAHIVFRFDYGGLENGLVNLINRTESAAIRHVVISLTEVTQFADRLKDNVQVHAIGKRPGRDLRAYHRLYKLLRRIGPDIVHTRNMGTMDCVIVAFLARVPIRVHGEHGWDTHDPNGTRLKYRYLRRFLTPFIHRVVTVSDDLARWLTLSVGTPAAKVRHIYNGVDTERFFPAVPEERAVAPAVVVGSVTRFAAIKDPLNLVEAFVKLPRSTAAKLVMLGSGELHDRAKRVLREANLESDAWLPGSREDIAEQLRRMDVFVLASLREGISNTILEAMASGLPIVATDTGGNRELVKDGVNGVLVPPGDSAALSKAIAGYTADADRRLRHGKASRERVISEFSIDAMIVGYRTLYEDVYKMIGN